MKKIVICLAFIFLFVGFCEAQSRSLTIDTLDNSDYKYLDGCGCSISSASRGREQSHNYYLLTPLENAIGKTAYMKINGQVMRLALLSTTRPSGKERKGTRFTEVYRGGGVTARVNYVVSKASGRGQEVTRYAITITASKGGNSQTISAVGDCGC
jgi:hypothetical protein